MFLGSLSRDGDFLKLWGGQAISKIGSTITSVGIPLTASFVLGASPLQMGILAASSGAGVLVFGLFAGAWADRLRRRPILIGADLARAALLGTIPLAAALHRLNMPHLYTVGTLAGILTVIFDVSYQAYLPSLVNGENIVEANSKLALTESIADITGPGLTGLLVQLITAPVAILLDALSFICSAVSVWLIRKPEPLPKPSLSPHIGREIAEGLTASWSSPVLRALLQRAATGPFFLGFIGGLYFLFARELHITVVLLGIIVSVGGVSSLLGALLAQPLLRRWGPGRTLIGAAWMTVTVHADGAVGPRFRGALQCVSDRLATGRHGVARLQHQRNQPAPGDHPKSSVGPREFRRPPALPWRDHSGSAGRRRHRAIHRNPSGHADRCLRLSALHSVAHLLPHPPRPPTERRKGGWNRSQPPLM